MKMDEKFNSLFIKEEVELDDEKKQLFLFDKEHMDEDKVSALVESFQSLYNEGVIYCSFNEYLDGLEIDYIDLGTLDKGDN